MLSQIPVWTAHLDNKESTILIMAHWRGKIISAGRRDCISPFITMTFMGAIKFYNVRTLFVKGCQGPQQGYFKDAILKDCILLAL